MNDALKIAVKIVSVSLAFIFGQSCVTSTSTSGPVASSSSVNTFQMELWLEDFRQLQGFMTTGYPNLDWQRQSLKLNLPELSAKTTAELNAATSDDQAKQILTRFLDVFHDAHLRLNLKPSLKTSASKQFTKDDEGSLVCQSLGMRNKDNSFRFVPNSTYKKSSTSESPFRYGFMKTKNGVLGILRIASFLRSDYEPLCVQEWNRFRNKMKDGSSCNSACMDTFLEEVLDNRLLTEVDRALSDLKRHQIDALLLDLTHNGGGTSWESAVRAMLTDKEMNCGKMGFIRHPHWITQFEEDLRESNAALAKAKSERETDHIKSKIAAAELDLSEAKKTCDLSNLWTDVTFQPDCSLIADVHGDPCHISARFRYTPGLYNGPLFVLVDDYTSSASEDLAARYQDNKAATIIGERTLAAGCGYTNGGIAYKLKNSGIEVKIPDCARFRVDHSNEVSGIQPDWQMDMKRIKEPQFFEDLIVRISEQMPKKN